jgi:hypothetical protein
METDSDLITVAVTIPRHRLSDLYVYAGRLAQPVPTAVEEATTERNWKEGDSSLAQQIVAAGNDHARAAWRALAMSSPESRLNGEQLDAAVQMPRRERNGLLSKMSRSCTTRGRDFTWQYDQGTDSYWMDPPVAELFRRALANYVPTT